MIRLTRTAEQYANYDAYLEHQATKARIPHLAASLAAGRQRRVAWFFARMQPFVSQASRCLCVGARYGEEVEALVSLGVASAIGVDIEARPPLVVAGDMHALEFADGSFDFVYTNAFDHALDPAVVAAELLRVLTPLGTLLLHAPDGDKPETFEALRWDGPADLIALFRDCGGDVRHEPMGNFHGLRHQYTITK